MDLFDFDVETNPAIHSDMDPDPASKNYVPLCSVQKNLALVFYCLLTISFCNLKR